MGSNRSGGGSSGKGRLKWTQELHVRFEKAINLLGGADRATPRSILRAMQVPELTIYHVKSHLQKYRIQKLIPESGPGAGGEAGKNAKNRNFSEMLRNFSSTSAAQFTEALRLQQQELHSGMRHQTEVQRSLELKVEAQRRFMERTADDGGRTSITNNSESISSSRANMVMPALSEYSTLATESDDDAENSSIGISCCNSYHLQDPNLKNKKKRPRLLLPPDDPVLVLPPPAFPPAAAYYDCCQYLLGQPSDNQQQQQLTGTGISPSSSLSYPADDDAVHRDVNSIAWNVAVSCLSPPLLP